SSTHASTWRACSRPSASGSPPCRSSCNRMPIPGRRNASVLSRHGGTAAGGPPRDPGACGEKPPLISTVRMQPLALGRPGFGGIRLGNTEHVNELSAQPPRNDQCCDGERREG